ncbi:MAG: alpha/beta fold hydrolase [Haloarculaceae archaeon]
MPTASSGELRLYYETAGDGPTVAFVNDVGFGAWLWGWQQPAVAGPCETLVWDLRGTGRSDDPDGPIEVATLAGDLEAVLSDAGVSDAHIVGAGLGGMVALEYAHRYSRARSLALFGTAASGAAVTDRLEALRADPADPTALRRSLSAAVAADLEDYPEVIDDIVEWRGTDDADLDAWDTQAAAMRAFDAPPLYEITLPALVFHGTDDEVVPIESGRALAGDLPRGEFRAVEGGHLCFVESARAVTDELLAFLEEQTDG